MKADREMPALSRTPSNREFERLSRFLAVGAVGTVLDFSLLTLFKLAVLPTLPANSLSFTAGLINNFTWNPRLTFHDAIHANWRTQLAQFTAVSLVGLALNNMILVSLETTLGSAIGRPEWGYLPAKGIATSLVVLWNYLANRAWTFKS